MTHLTRDELVRWRDRGEEVERVRVMGHLAACAECRGALAALVREAAVDEPSTLDPAPFVARGVAAYRPPRSWWQRPWVAASGLAAAAFALAIFVPRQPAPADDGIEVRSATLQPLAPVGEVRGPSEFRWASPFAATRYRLLVRDRNNRPVVTAETPDERYGLPANPGAQLPPGAYTWTVEALDASNQVIASSSPQSFTVLP